MATQKLIVLISSLLLLSFALASVNANEEAPTTYEKPKEKEVETPASYEEPKEKVVVETPASYEEPKEKVVETPASHEEPKEKVVEPYPSYEEPEEIVVDVVVEGVVYCQSCDAYGTWSLTGAKPIPSAKVSVICKDHKSRVSFYKVFATDKNGYFYGELDGFKMDHYLLDHPLHACGVHLVSSPLSNCNQLSNVNYGINGSPLRYNNKRLFGSNYEAVIYSSGPLAFRPSFCPKTDDHY